MSVFVRQEKITVRMGLQSDPIDLTKMRLMCINNRVRYKSHACLLPLKTIRNLVVNLFTHDTGLITE